MPPPKSTKTFPSTSVRVAPSVRAAKIGVVYAHPRGIATSRRARSARDRGPGTGVRRSIVFVIGVSSRRLRIPAGVDRKSVVKGKSVDLGGRRIIKKKKKKSREM